MSGLILFFDTETTGMIDFKGQLLGAHQPDMIQLAAILAQPGPDWSLTEVDSFYGLVKPANPNFSIEPGAQAVHGITRERILAEGTPVAEVLTKFYALMDRAELLVAHNVEFDTKIMAIAKHRSGIYANDPERSIKTYCTMQTATSICKIPGKYGFKWPRLDEAHQFFLNAPFEKAHDAMADVKACMRVFTALKTRKAV